MPRAFILMTALPPTLGHLRLIQFSQALAPTTVIVCTQPGEPYPYLRHKAIAKAADSVYAVYHLHKTLEQNPEAPGFWEMWQRILASYGFKPGDYIVASEVYGQQLADAVGGVFMPFDLNRTIQPGKATFVRLDPLHHWDYILPEFRAFFTKRVTLFGAESVGKTTMSQQLADYYKSPWLFEWARPYLEAVGSEVTEKKMVSIWNGQLALQKSARNLVDSPVVFQDTDLFSTLGYWEMWDEETMPSKLALDALGNQSDLYLICPSNIPFEPDPLRYGGDQRESSDQYWIDLCEREGLNYRVLTGKRHGDRIAEATRYVDELLRTIDFTYERTYNG